MSKRVLAMASGGGHFVQLLRLRPAFEGHEVHFATVHRASESEVGGAPFHVFRDVSRADWWRLPLALFDIARLLLKVRPQVIVTTGALPPLLALLLVKPFGVRTLWVDSIANSEVLSGSGQLARRIASRTITQWPALAEPDVQHWGSVL
ncbi:UDP-N-acetylglucosamine--LPS N-acetylglucosamine transferase [Polymorphobacter sp.]|uniref:UDP-N-acetylglucosamine--LPS N-acetylglucosamine transferase n=1 Tax=Polymorphobacter sp. TaxID=1909290 RepID=UPI003F715B2A